MGGVGSESTCGIDSNDSVGFSIRNREYPNYRFLPTPRDRTPKAKVMKREVGGRERKDRERLEGSQEVLVLGDSRIRYLDETF